VLRVAALPRQREVPEQIVGAPAIHASVEMEKRGARREGLRGARPRCPDRSSNSHVRCMRPPPKRPAHIVRHASRRPASRSDVKAWSNACAPSAAAAAASPAPRVAWANCRAGGAWSDPACRGCLRRMLRFFRVEAGRWPPPCRGEQRRRLGRERGHASVSETPASASEPVSLQSASAGSLSSVSIAAVHCLRCRWWLERQRAGG
jgi:hypothetical protein